nr:putative Gag-Pol polyprotein [Tanacetum cinerariifolium]
MAVLEYCAKHNMIAYLEKIKENARFHEIMDFLSRSSIFYAFTLEVELQAKVERERQREEQASMEYIANLDDKVQVRIDVDHELAVRWTHEEHAELITDFVPIGSKKDERMIRDMNEKVEEESGDKERRYPLTTRTLERMRSLRLIVESASDAAYDLLRFIQKILRSFITDIENIGVSLGIKKWMISVLGKAEAVNTACYVQNKVLVIKPHNKTPYELFNERSSAIGFLRPFGCHVMILNTLDHLGKFDAKGDKGYFIGYSLSSKAFRVFNKRTKKIEENLHVDFLKNRSIEKGTGPGLLFDIDTLTNSMNYVPVVIVGTSSTNILGTKEDVHQALKENESPLRFIALLNWFHKAQMATSNEDAKKDDAISDNNAPQKEQEDLASSSTVETKVPTVSTPVPTGSLYVPLVTLSVPKIISRGVSIYLEPLSLGNAMSFKNRLEDFFRDTSDAVSLNDVEADLRNMETAIQVRPTGTKWVLKNKKDERGIVIRNKASLVVQGHTQEEENDYEEVFAPVARIDAIRLFLAYTSYMGFTVYQMDVKSAFLYRTIDEEVYVMHPPSFQDLEFRHRVYKVEKAMYGLHQAPRAWYGTLSKYLLDNGIQRGTIDQTLFIRKKKREFLLIQVVETTDEETKILAKVNGRQRTVSESSIRRHLKLNDEEATNKTYNFLKMIFDGMMRNVKRKGKFLMYPRFIEKLLEMSQFGVIKHTEGEGSKHPSEPHYTTSDQDESMHHEQISQSPQHEQTTSQEPTIPSQSHSVITTPRRITRGTIQISQSKVPSPGADEITFLIGDARYGEGFLTVTGLDARHDREKIAKTSAMPYEASPRVTSLGGEEGSIGLRGCSNHGGGGGGADKGSDSTDEMANVLGTLGAANILASRGLRSVFTTASLSVSTASTIVSPVVATASGSFPTAAVFTTASVATPTTRVTRSSRGVVIEYSSLIYVNIPSISKKDKGKGKMIEPKQHSKEKVLEQISVQLARDLKAKFAQEDQIIREQAEIDSEIAMIHAKRELEMMIAELDRSNEMVAKYLIRKDSFKKLKIAEASSIEPTQEQQSEEPKELSDEELMKRMELWSLVKETCNTTEVTDEKVKELWVELNRLYEPDSRDPLWALQRYMHDPLVWRLYDTCGVHHVCGK